MEEGKDSYGLFSSLISKALEKIKKSASGKKHKLLRDEVLTSLGID
jgi:hypothetical protein